MVVVKVGVDATTLEGHQSPLKTQNLSGCFHLKAYNQPMPSKTPKSIAVPLTYWYLNYMDLPLYPICIR